MENPKEELGIIGLGKMGGNLALQGVEKGMRVIGKTRKVRSDLEEKGVRTVKEYDPMIEFLHPPRVIYLSLPAGGTVDQVIRELLPHLEAGDVIIDGGNSFYLDSIRREKEVRQKNVFLLDCGTSGGISGARNGACFMVGGREEGVRIAGPLLERLAVKDGFLHTGDPGSGHFVKLVHNGIEFGMLQAIGEGFSLLTSSGFNLQYADIFRNWSHGSVLRGWLVELMEAALRAWDFEKVESFVEDTGEVNWLVQDAVNKEIPIPVIAQSIMELFRSRDKESDTYRAIAMMRRGFGGHPFGKDERIAAERKLGRTNLL